MTKPKLWTRDFIFVSALSFFLTLVFFLLMVVIGVYATREYGASPSQAGLVAGVFIIGVLAGRFFVGKLMALVGRKRGMLIGLFLAVLACALYLVDGGVYFLIANRFFHGFAVGLAATAVATVVAYLIPASRTGEGLGYFGIASSMATAIGPFIGIFMLQHAAFQWILLLCLMLSICCIIVGFFLHVPELEQAEASGDKRRFSLTDMLEYSAVPLSSIVFLVAMYYSSVLAFLNLYAIEQNLGEAASLFFVVFAVTLLVSRPFTGRLLDSRGANIIVYPALLVLGLGLAALGYAESGMVLLFSAVLIGLGFGNVQSCIQAVIIKQANRQRLAMVTSTFYIFVDAGLGFGPYFLGLLVPFTGYADLYKFLGVLACCSIVVYYMVHGKKSRLTASGETGY